MLGIRGDIAYSLNSKSEGTLLINCLPFRVGLARSRRERLCLLSDMLVYSSSSFTFNDIFSSKASIEAIAELIGRCGGSTSELTNLLVRPINLSFLDSLLTRRPRFKHLQPCRPTRSGASARRAPSRSLRLRRRVPRVNAMASSFRLHCGSLRTHRDGSASPPPRPSDHLLPRFTRTYVFVW